MRYRSPITGRDVDAHTYITEWHSFIDPMEEKYELIALSYDSDIRFARKCNKNLPAFYSETVTLPLWLVKQLIEAK